MHEILGIVIFCLYVPQSFIKKKKRKRKKGKPRPKNKQKNLNTFEEIPLIGPCNYTDCLVIFTLS